MPEGKCGLHSFIKQTSLCNWQKQILYATTNQNTEVWSPVRMDTCRKQLLNLKLREHCRKGSGRFVKPRGSGSFLSKIVFLINVRIFTHKLATT